MSTTSTPRISLTRYLMEQQRQNQRIPAQLRLLLEVVARACKQISHAVNKGALGDVLGSANSENVQGEVQKKLDIIANEVLIEANEWGGHLAAMASEEMDNIYAVPNRYPQGEYLLMFDPLDGSSNIDINMAVGTIFSILPYQRQGQISENSDFLQAGNQQLAAGYLLYCTSTVLALTITDNVVMFSLDPDTNDYVLIEENVTIDADTSEYAINASNYRYWRAPMQQYIDELIAGKTGVRGRDFNTRWVAAMVGDVHRILCRGGVFTYPFDTKDANKAGKLRLMYEANPMSLLIERAGGAATDAVSRILDIAPTDSHQRVPVVLGSKNEVEYVKNLHVNYTDK